jgi:hypothetical protein
MNGLNNAAPAAVTAEVAPIAKAVKAAVIVARKSLMGKWKKTGAPPKEIIGLTKNPARGAFTKHDIFERNGRTISLLTIDKRIKQLAKARTVFRMADALKTDGPGRPSYRYTFDASKAPAKKTRKAKVNAETPAVVAPEAPAIDLNTPAMPVTPAPVVEVPAAIETPAQA